MLNFNSTDEEICDYYYSNWSCMVKDIVEMTGKSKDEVKAILLKSNNNYTVIIG